MQAIDIIFYIAILIMSVVCHELAHGWAAYYYGDNTAKYAGRLTANPIKHLDLFGSVILPGLLAILNTGFLVGWAKPVPINERNFKKRREGLFVVSIAGIAANMLIAIIFTIVLHIATFFGVHSEAFSFITGTIIFTNLILAFFNIMPIPPLDGSKILLAAIPGDTSKIERFFDRYGLVVAIIFIVFIWDYIVPIVYKAYDLLVGPAA